MSYTRCQVQYTNTQKQYYNYLLLNNNPQTQWLKITVSYLFMILQSGLGFVEKAVSCFTQCQRGWPPSWRLEGSLPRWWTITHRVACWSCYWLGDQLGLATKDLGTCCQLGLLILLHAAPSCGIYTGLFHNVVLSGQVDFHVQLAFAKVQKNRSFQDC